MNVSVISWSISFIIILLVVVGQPTRVDRDKRMANNQFNSGGQIFNSFFSLIDSFGSNENQGQNGGTYGPSGETYRPSGGTYRPSGGSNRPSGGHYSSSGGHNRPSGGSNRPNGGNVQCSPNNQCGKGYGDCETDRDCRQGLLCGKNNCKGEFGSFSPEGIPWERKDDCCTDNPNYCNPLDKLPSSRRTCCSPSNPCPFSHGDCDVDADCQSGLMCGDNNCKDFHTGAGNKDDCCTYRENGGNQPTSNGGNPQTGNGGSQPNGGLQQCSPNNRCGKGFGDCETDQDCLGGLFCGKNNCKGEFGARAPDGSLWDDKDDCCTDNRHYCNQANLFPSWRRTCCGPNNPCPFKHGDCDKDDDCVSNLVCGDNNCRDFHANAGNKDDCCTYQDYKKKRSVEGDQISSLPEDQVGKTFNETIDGEKDRSKRDARFWNNNNGGFSSSNGFQQGRPNGGFSSGSGGYRPSNGGFGPNNGAYRPSNGGFSPNNGGFTNTNGRPNGGNRPIGGNRPTGGSRPNGGSRPTGGNRPNGGTKLSGCEAEPSFRCCTQERPCSLGGGDCTGDSDCQPGLVCGSNNCRKFHPLADKKMDCCAFKKIK